jgi:hypothetical protein
MAQRTLDGKTDCRGVKGSCTVRLSGNVEKGKAKEMLEGLKEVKKKYPCVKVTVNKKPLEEEIKRWDSE